MGLPNPNLNGMPKGMNPMMTNRNSNMHVMPKRNKHTLDIPRISPRSSQSGHAGMMRPRMGLPNQNLKTNRMINMHSRNMNPNPDYNGVMMPSGQEEERIGCWGCAALLFGAASGIQSTKALTNGYPYP